MTRDEALAELRAATRRFRLAQERATTERLRLYAVIRAVRPVLRQIDAVRITQWSREHLRQIVGGPWTP